MPIQILPFSGDQVLPYIEALASLRISVFRDFPYLYDGNMEYEAGYLKDFIQAPDSVLVLAFDGHEVIGASTGLPLACEPGHIKGPFLDNGFNPESVFYFGESVLKQPYRGQGIGRAFFQERENWASSLGRFDTLAFCAVIRPEDHPLRPRDYQPLDIFWQHRGFAPTDMIAYLSWKDLDETGESPKPLRFWVKSV